MAELSTHTRAGLAHRSHDGLNVTLIWTQRDGGDKAAVSTSDRQEGAYFEISPSRAWPSTSTGSPTASSTVDTTTVVSRRSPMIVVGVAYSTRSGRHERALPGRWGAADSPVREREAGDSIVHRSAAPRPGSRQRRFSKRGSRVKLAR
jgi:hypothetical protein